MGMKAYLLIDFGSTYTKLTLVDLDQGVILGTSKAMTTVETNIMEGFTLAYEDLNKRVDLSNVEIIKRLACSSAAGGLKMVTLGLVPELTVEASKRAALGAGARVLKTYSYEITNAEIKEIQNLKVDMILLSGGTDGGNEEVIIANAKKIAKNFKHTPIIVAGNKCTYDRIEEIFSEEGIVGQFTENVMPRLNEINVEPVRELIRELFMKNITKSKGMDVAESFVDGILMPTPAAVLRASEVLAKGTDETDGLGDLIVIDIGGATTDVHSLCDGFPSKAGINLRGLKEPFAKRTVEGDLGMRVSALSLYEATSVREIREYLPEITGEELARQCHYRHDHVDFVPQTKEEIAFDEAMAKVAARLAMKRHAGRLEVAYTPLGEMFNQFGKDLLETKVIIGTGGVIVHSERPSAILKESCFRQDDPTSLCPINPRLMTDQHYILSAMGLLSFDFPDVALKIMKDYIKEI